MARAGDGAAQIHQVHDVAAEHVSEQIRGAGQAEFGIFGFGLANRAHVERFVRMGLIVWHVSE